MFSHRSDHEQSANGTLANEDKLEMQSMLMMRGSSVHRAADALAESLESLCCNLGLDLSDVYRGEK